AWPLMTSMFARVGLVAIILLALVENAVEGDGLHLPVVYIAGLGFGLFDLFLDESFTVTLGPLGVALFARVVDSRLHLSVNVDLVATLVVWGVVAVVVVDV